MNAGDDHVKLRQHRLRIIERSVGKNVALGSAQQADFDHLLHGRDLVPLALQPIERHTACVVRRRRVIGDREVLHAHRLGRPRHFLDRAFAIGIDGVAVHYAADVGKRDQVLWQAARHGGLDFAAIFAQLRCDIVQAQAFIELALVGGRRCERLLFLRAERFQMCHVPRRAGKPEKRRHERRRRDHVQLHVQSARRWSPQALARFPQVRSAAAPR